MAKFRDRKGRDWLVEFNGATAIRLSKTRFDLMSALDKNADLLRKLQYDPVFLVEFAYAICEPQAERLGVSAEEFGEGMYADVLEQAADAIAEELVLFSRSRGPLLRKAMQKMRDVEQAVEQRAMDELTNMDVEAILQEYYTATPNRVGPPSGNARDL